MAYKVVITKSAADDVKKLTLAVKKQLYKKLLHVSSLPDVKVVAKKLHEDKSGE